MKHICTLLLIPLMLVACYDNSTPKKRKKKQAATQKRDDVSPKKLTFETDLWNSLCLLAHDDSDQNFQEAGKPLKDLTGHEFFAKLDELLNQSKPFRSAFFDEIPEGGDGLLALKNALTENNKKDIVFLQSRLVQRKLKGRIESVAPFHFDLIMEGPLPDLGSLLHDSSVVFCETRNVAAMSALIQGFNKNERAASLPGSKLRLVPGFGNEKVELAYAVDTDTMDIGQRIRKYASSMGKYKGVKLAWSIHPAVLSVLQHQSGNTHALYGLRKPASGSTLTNGYTDGAELIQQGYDWVFSFKFVPDARDEWEQALRKSTSKGPNPWAVLVNGRVLATPPRSAYSSDGSVNIVLGSTDSPGFATWANTWIKAFNQPLKNRYNTKVEE